MQKLYLATAVSSILIGGNVSAQDAAGIDLGGFQLFPTVALDLTLDDNVIRSSDDEIRSYKRTVVPAFTLVNNYGPNQIQFGYQLTRADYYSSSADDFTDHLLSASAALELNSRNRLNVSALYDDGHDDRGTSFTIGNGDSINSVDTYKNPSVNAVYSYGAMTAKGRVDFTAGYSIVDYDIDTDRYRSRDLDRADLGSTFYYRVMPATDLTFDVTYADVSYDFALDPTQPLDSTETRALVGAQWESTAKTTGYVKVGYRNKDFAAAGRESFNGLDWRVGVTWEPLTYSTVDFTAFTNTNETNGEGDFIETNTYRASWDHQWLERTSTTVNASYSTDTYTGAGSDREDKNTTIGMFLNYEMRRWVLIQAGYTFDQRSSNRETIEFDRNLFSVSATVSL
ncbi:outer membrane beta-barrel protein [Alteromonas gilva]|uniref:Outer membrane beta-barrel protein n=1 Tax=Alteromonas gilva TaxID=2987522 RepID=A0ABT5L115_9ALTE|nr:outer membrane beta-barrel protein [Alteromonas gilva]MDC8829567.1 outer membrane beta-barrel protein [Alteromonas gilva]